MTRYAMALDTHTCIGCLACTVACKVENGSPEGIWFAPVLGQEFGEYPDVRRAYLPLLCNHCEDAPCIKACPTGAIGRRSDGIVLIDQDRCCGSRACVIACPYGAIHYYEKRQVPETRFDEVKVAQHKVGTAQKCTFCASRIDRGLKPACIDVCPTGARIFGDLDDPNSPVAKAFAAPDAVQLGAPVETRPKTRYLVRGVQQAGGTSADVVLPFKPQGQWDVFQAIQFFLFGIAGGLFTASRFQQSLVTFADHTYDLGALLAVAFLSIGGLVLIGHLGRPLHFLNAVRNWKRCWISRGAIADFVFFVLAILLIPADWSVFREITTVAAVFAGAIVAVYPGVALDSMRSVPGWNRAQLPAKFLIEALLMGSGVAGLLSGYSVKILTVMAALAALQLSIALLNRRFEQLSATAAGAIVILSFMPLVFSVAAPVLGPVATGIALVHGFVNKLNTLRKGERPSPFGIKGELQGFAHV